MAVADEKGDASNERGGNAARPIQAFLRYANADDAGNPNPLAG